MTKVYDTESRRRFLDSRDKRAASANMIIENQQGELLVLKANYKQYWSLPGGWMDGDESAREAARRELEEETGLVVPVDEIIFDSVVERQGDIVKTYLFVFRTRTPLPLSLAELNLQTSEIDEAKFVTKSDVRERPGDYNFAVRNWAAPQPQSYAEVVLQQ